MAADHYRLLGVPHEADTAEIRLAYLRLMRTCHPDVRPGDLTAAELARQANLAWRTLRDPIRRAAYDRQLAAAVPAALGPEPQPTGSPSQSAYVERRKAYGRAFHAATLRLAAAVFSVGLGVLIFVSR